MNVQSPQGKFIGLNFICMYFIEANESCAESRAEFGYYVYACIMKYKDLLFLYMLLYAYILTQHYLHACVDACNL